MCVITGAAGGVGLATARRLAQEGATVVGVDLVEHAAGALCLQADVTDEAQVRDLYARVRDELGRIDVLFNNAGLNDPDDGSALEISLESWSRVQAANLTSVFLCCKHGIPHLLANDPPAGSVINTATFLAVMGAATAQMAYSASRAGVLALSRDLGVHLAKRGVRVNALCIGPIDTPALRELFADDPDKVAQRNVHMPMGRFGRPDEVAATVAYLASDDAGYVTASAFPLDGGITAAYTIPGATDQAG
ncbi:MAG TPA: SDR family oxidoreductase [Candidatus Limnocylindrales bacterium]|nr:SDR family oxidoreductase [Candidatus Limnocylindrales bacterium]